MAEQNHPDHVLLKSLFASTAVTGLIHGVSFLGLGHIFTANMTGNIVFLGIATAGTQSLSVPRSLASLAAFLFGALIGGRTASSVPFQAIRGLAKIMFGIEALLLLSATLASIGIIDASINSGYIYAVIVLTASAMGVRNAAVRKMSVPDLTTTVLTLTVTGLAADSSFASSSNQRWQRRLVSILLMFLGAAVGALLVNIRSYCRWLWPPSYRLVAWPCHPCRRDRAREWRASIRCDHRVQVAASIGTYIHKND